MTWWSLACRRYRCSVRSHTRFEGLESGKSPFLEPHLTRLLRRNRKESGKDREQGAQSMEDDDMCDLL